MKNDYMRRIQADVRRKCETAIDIYQQYDMDTLLIALHTEFGFGYDRLKKVLDAWGTVHKHYEKALNYKYVEADVLQEQMDNILREICEGHQEFYPFRERYPNVREITYE